MQLPMSEAMTQQTPKFEINCIWCSAPWSDDNLTAHAEISNGYDDHTGPEVDSITIKIKCHACGKVMYEKEQDGNYYG